MVFMCHSYNMIKLKMKIFLQTNTWISCAVMFTMCGGGIDILITRVVRWNVIKSDYNLIYCCVIFMQDSSGLKITFKLLHIIFLCRMSHNH